MKCHYCQRDFPLTKLQFVEDGMVPGIQMKRRRAQCFECSRKPDKIVIDGGEPTVSDGGAQF